MSVKTLPELPAAGAVTFDASRALLATLSIAERRFCWTSVVTLDRDSPKLN